MRWYSKRRMNEWPLEKIRKAAETKPGKWYTHLQFVTANREHIPQYLSMIRLQNLLEWWLKL